MFDSFVDIASINGTFDQGCSLSTFARKKTGFAINFRFGKIDQQFRKLNLPFLYNRGALANNTPSPRKWNSIKSNQRHNKYPIMEFRPYLLPYRIKPTPLLERVQ